jgi:short-subunit dehydrogenase
MPNLMPDRPTALVTGASSGIGLEIARELAARGHDLVLVARSRDRLQAEAGRLQQQHGIRVHALAEDLASPDAPARIQAALDRQSIVIDVLVNNAGYGVYGRFVETPLDRELAMIQLNVVALTELTKRFLPGMVARRQGRVLNVASTAAFQPGPLMAVYYATKAYVLSVSEALASELEHSGVTVTTLCPGPTASGFQAAAGQQHSRLVKGRRLPDSASVARRGVDGLFRGERVVIPGARNWLLAQSIRFLPRRRVADAVKRMQEPTD